MTKTMADQDQKIILDLKSQLSNDLKKRVIKFILYGSRARGTGTEDSDLDLVALVDEKTPEIESALDDIAYRVMWDYDFKPIISLRSSPRYASSVRQKKDYHFTSILKWKAFPYD